MTPRSSLCLLSMFCSFRVTELRLGGGGGGCQRVAPDHLPIRGSFCPLSWQVAQVGVMYFRAMCNNSHLEKYMYNELFMFDQEIEGKK